MRTFSSELISHECCSIVRTGRVRRAFTLIELLVVVAIIGLLIAVLLPALGKARKSSSAVVCMAQLRGIAQGFTTYSADNDELVIPSYNMTGTSGAGVPLDGWGPILDRDGYMDSQQNAKGNPFYCPDTFDVPGVATGQTGTDPNNPKGWLDWPFMRTGSANVTQIIPERNFHKVIRVAYWINADNPIGNSVAFTPDLFYTCSVGYGPNAQGQTMKAMRTVKIVNPVAMITAADGLYAGRQRDNRIGMTNSRIGYRHPAKMGSANVAFADGHVETLGGNEFPRALGGTKGPDVIRDENTFGKPSVYANPERVFAGS